jgi:hypothetical protein
MGLHQFNKNKFLLKLRFNKNKSKYIKYGSITIGIILILFAVIYFSFSKYTVSNKYSVIETTVGDFSKTKNVITYLNSIQTNNTGTMSYDGTSDNNLRYYGSNPNNYITYNGELWRIIGVMNNMTTSDGKTTSLVKIVRANSIGSYSASSNNSNDWSSLSINTVLNNYYYNKTTGTCYVFNGNTSSIGVTSTSCDFSSTGLNTYAKSMIQSVVWKLGGEPYPGTYTTSTYYNGERSTSVYSGHSTTWTGNIGLIYPSDYGYATSGGLTTNKSTCLGYNLYTWNSYNDCYSNDYLYTNNIKWTMTPLSSHSTDIYTIQNTGNVFWGSYWTSSNNEIYPSLYLKANILLTGGKGTSSDPYTIINPINTYDYTGAEQTFTAPITGFYKVELWGASGAGYNSTYYGGAGGYTSGVINLKKDNNYYLYVGGQGLFTSSIGTGSYNGGGNTPIEGYGTYFKYFGGGGATDMRIVDGIWNNSTSLASRIMVAAGGGAGGYGGSDGAGGYVTNSYVYTGIGGAAGGLKSFDNIATSPNSCGVISSVVGYATQTASIKTSNYSITLGKFGAGSMEQNTGSGSGYYGGPSMNCTYGGSGGSSYISGHNGCVAITAADNISPKSGCSDGTTDISCSYHYSGNTFSNTVMVDGRGYSWTNAVGASTGMPTHDGTSTMTGNAGNGYAKITYIGSSLK